MVGSSYDEQWPSLDRERGEVVELYVARLSVATVV